MPTKLTALVAAFALVGAVAITGCGPIGLFAIAVARAVGASQVFAIETNEHRRNIAAQMKADLVSLFVAEALHKQGYYTDAQLRSVYAGGILRVLQNNKPRRDQPYNTMQLMQWNFFLENGLLTFENGILRIHYDKYHSVIGKMLAKVLEVQYAGDKAAADRFIDQYAVWKDDLHGVVAKNIRDAQRYRFRLFKYVALGE